MSLFARSLESLQDTNLEAFLTSSSPLVNETLKSRVAFVALLLLLL
jgi:hypothetical protein